MPPLGSWMGKPMDLLQATDADMCVDLGSRQTCMAKKLLHKAQAPSGGWGPYVSSAPEVFDTADWPRIFRVPPTPLKDALRETFAHPVYSEIELEF